MWINTKWQWAPRHLRKVANQALNCLTFKVPYLYIPDRLVDEVERA